MRGAGVVALALGLLVALGLGELVARLAADLSPRVAYLATASMPPSERRFSRLQDYLASKIIVAIPHRNWFNYWTNAVGMNDEEFAVPKPPGRFRIMAVGDSFTYGLVPYPYATMTVVESLVRSACGDKDLDLLNLGIAGTEVSEYRTLVTLALATYEPDLVLVNLYAGDDVPDPFRDGSSRPGIQELASYSYLWSLAASVVKVKRAVKGRAPSGLHGGAPPGVTPHGGAVVDPTLVLRDDDPALIGPFFTERAYTTVLAKQLRRLYVPPRPERLDSAWSSLYADIDGIRSLVGERGGRLVLALFPSEIQVYPRMREALIPTLRQQALYSALSPQDVDPRLPNKRLAAYCESRDLPCIDVTDALVVASQSSDEPLYKKRDGHWNIRGNRVAAEAEARILAGLVCPDAASGKSPRP